MSLDSTAWDLARDEGRAEPHVEKTEGRRILEQESEEVTFFEDAFAIGISQRAGKWFTMTATSPHPKTYTFSVTGQGSCSYKPTATFVEGGKTFLYIGIKSPHGEATGTAYFDDVYVLR